MSNPQIIEHQEKIGIGTVNVAGFGQMMTDVESLSADWFYNWSPTVPADDVQGWYIGSGASTVSEGTGYALRLVGSDGWAIQTVKLSAGSPLTISFDAQLHAGSGGVVIEYQNAAGTVVSSSFAQLSAGAKHYSVNTVAGPDVVAARIVTYATPTGELTIDKFSLTDSANNQITNGDFEARPSTGMVTNGFVPMIWNGAQMGQLASIASAHPGEALLTFNEPDNAAQANMTVARALSYWPALMGSGMRLGSPAVTFGNTLGANSWLGQFMNAADASGYRVDFIAVHYYPTDPSVSAFEEFLNSVHEAYGRPVWVTEWSLADWSNTDRFTADQQAAFFVAATQMMDDLPFVERQAWFSAYEGMDSYFLNSGLIDAGSLSVVGDAFKVLAKTETPAIPLGTDGDDTLAGGDPADALFGGKGNDMIEGRGGADRIDGGEGIDLASYASSAAGVQVDLSVAAQDGGDAEGDWLVNIENVRGSDHDDVLTGDDGANVLHGLAGSDRLYGGKGDDSLYGGDGDDTLNGGMGADRMVGGLGGDIYIVDSFADVTIEDAGGGTDTVKTLVDSYVLSANVENLVLAGTAGLSGTGNGSANTLTGNDGANVLFGLAGSDRLYGGKGDDALNGGDDHDFLYGGDGNDRLEGGAGNDTLDGRVGADIMHGGAGNDIYFVDGLGDVVAESANGGADTVRSLISQYTLGDNVEKLVLVGPSGQTGIGNDLGNTMTGSLGADTLIGGGGNDVLDGNDGADHMDGGAGDDTFYVDDSGDIVVERGAEGRDTVRVDLFDYTLAANVENLILSGQGDLAGNGNSLDNVLTGNVGANAIHGGTGNDEITGGDGADRLWGDAGDDVLSGGLGRDWLNGGMGKDTFKFALADSVPSGPDNIADFLAGTDIINLSAIDANTGKTGNQAFSFIGTSSFSQAAGQLRFEQSSTTDGQRYVLVEADMNGDGIADYALHLQGSAGALQMADFVL
ncbi:MAG: glycosyl hydrolase [Pseudomonadota bacterium]